MHHARASVTHHLYRTLQAKPPQDRIRQAKAEIPCAEEKCYHDQAWSSAVYPPQCDMLHIEIPQGSCYKPFAEEPQRSTDLNTNSMTPHCKPLTCEDAWRFTAEITTIYTPLATPQHSEPFDIATLCTPLATPRRSKPNDIATLYNPLASPPREWSLNDDGLTSVDKRWRHEQQQRERRPLPKLVYLQNPLAWLANKLDFNVLRRLWDPDFDEWEFRRGAKQAISTVTHLIAADNFADMKGLLTPSALTSLKRQPIMSWGDKKKHVGVHPDDIQLALPRKLHFNTLIDQKFCDIDMMFVALKWVVDGTAETIIYLESIARFHREYTEGRVSDWTISLFRITKFKSFPGYGKLL